MNEVLKDEEVKSAIALLQSKGVTFGMISQVYKHYYSNLPSPGSRIQVAYGIYDVLENYSNMYRTEEGFIHIRNSVGTDIYLQPHEYKVLRKAPSSPTESA